MKINKPRFWTGMRVLTQMINGTEYRRCRIPLGGGFALVTLLVLAVGMTSAKAASYVWDGGGSDNAWTTADNWVSGTPGNNGNINDIYTFTSSIRDTSSLSGDSGFLITDGRFINQLIYDSGTDTDILLRLSTTATSARQLTFRKNSSNTNPSLTVQEGATGNIVLGNLYGAVRIETDLTVLHYGSGTLSITMPVNGEAGAGIIKTGTGTLILSGNNTYTGLTDVQAGTLMLNRSGGTIANDAPVKVSGGTLNVAQADTVGAVELSSGTISGAGTLTSTNAFDMQAGTVSGKLGGSVGLNKTTAGTVTLSGANTYSGLTTVSEGTLLVNNASGSGTGTGAVTVDSGASLGGSGTITGSVTNNGTISGGTDGTVGTLATDAITFNDGSTLVVDMNGTATDLLASSGVATIEGGAELVFNATGLTLGSYTLMTYTSRTGTFTVSGSVPAGYVLTYGDTALTLDLDIGSVDDGSWNVDDSGLWDTDSNWLADTIASGPNQTATFNNDITADRTVTLDSERCIGQIVFGDADTGSAGGWTIDGNDNVLTLDGGIVTVNALGSGKTAEISATIAGGAGLTKAGAGTLILGGANTYDGNTVVNAGKLMITGTSAYTGSTTLNGGILTLSGGNNRLPTGATVDFAGTSTMEIDSVNQSLSGVTLVNGVTGTITGGGDLVLTGSLFDVGGTANNTSQTLSLSGLGSFTYNNSSGTFKVGGSVTSGDNITAGTVTLPGTATITASSFGVGNSIHSSNAGPNLGTLNLGAATTINADTIQLGNNQARGIIQYTTATTPTLTLRGSDGSSPVNSMNIGQGSGFNVANYDSLVDLTNSVTGNGTIDAKITTLSIGYFARTASGGGGTYTGELRMGTGNLEVGTIYLGRNLAGAATAGNAAGTLSVSGGIVKVNTLYLGDSPQSVGTISGVFNLNNEAHLYAETINAGAGTATRTFNWNEGTIHNYDSSADLTIGANFNTFVLNGAAAAHIFDIDSGRLGTVDQAMSGAGALTKTGAGTLTLCEANMYSGGTTVNAGTLKLGADNPLGGGMLSMNGGTLGTSGGARALTNAVSLLAASTTVDTAGGNLTLSGAISNTGAVVKVSSGTLTLSGANTFSGETTVSAGTLAITGSSTLSDTAALRIASGATVNLAVDVDETINELYLATTQMAAGTWGSTVSAAVNKNNDYFSGNGILTVLIGAPGGTTFRFR